MIARHANGNPKAASGTRKARIPAFAQAGLAVALFFGAALAIDTAFAGGTRFAALSPHPFWLIVLLISARFGLVPGLLTAAFSSAILLAGHLPEQTFDQDRYQYLYAVSQLPLAWLLGAGLVGGMRTWQLQGRARFAARDAEACRSLEALTAAYRKLKASADRLEEHIAGEERTVNALCEAGRDLSLAVSGSDPYRALHASASVVRELLRPQQFSLFLAMPGGCRAVLTEGWPGEAPWASELAPDSELVRRVVGDRTLLSIGRPEDRYLLHRQGVLAGPLVDPESGEAFGMLKVEQMAFLDLNTYNVESFRIACEWLGPALAGLLGPRGGWSVRSRAASTPRAAQPWPLVTHAHRQGGDGHA